MRSVTIQKPVVDLKATGAQIKSLRIKYGFSVHDIQNIFGFEYPQAVYAWDRERRLQAGKMLKWSILSESPSSYAAKGGKNVPTIDNLLVLAHLFDVAIEEIVIQHMIEVDIPCTSNNIEKLCSKNCDDCIHRLSA